MPWLQKGATYYHAQLEHPDKVRAIQGLVVCYVVWLESMIYGMGLLTSARCVGRVPCYGQDGYQVQLLQHPIDICRYNTTKRTIRIDILTVETSLIVEKVCF